MDTIDLAAIIENSLKANDVATMYKLVSRDPVSSSRIEYHGSMIACAELAVRLYRRLGMGPTIYRPDGRSLGQHSRPLPLPGTEGA
jgi:hypothetical protein